VNVRWGLAALLELLGGRRTFLLATERWDAPVPVRGRWPDLPTERIDAIDVGDAEVLLALGGGSTIDTAKAVSARSDLPLVSVPTTYSGAEWTAYYGVRTQSRRRVGAGGGARLEAIVYDVALTLGLPRDVTGGTAMNALAHACEALYAKGRDPGADPIALEGAELISSALPRVLADPGSLEGRRRLLEGAARAGEALARSGLALAHAIAQTIGGSYGIAHGAMNAVALAPALRFNAEFVSGELLGGRAAERAAELANATGFTSLRALGVPADDFGELAKAIVRTPGARSNPRPVDAAQVVELLRTVA
jgi:alcohol dehydrogenase class IV